MVSKKIFAITLGILVGSSLSLYAARIKAAGNATHKATLSSYYYTPMGLTYMGTDKNGNPGSDLGYAPVSFWMETAAEVKGGGSFEWEFPTGLNADGSEKLRTSTSEQLQFRMTDNCTVSAPVLTVTSGTDKISYTAAEKIRYGALGTEENFAVNYQPSDTESFETAAEALTINDASAEAILNMAFGGGLFSNIHLYGFAESFYYGKDFWIQAVGVELQSARELTEADVELIVFERHQTSVSTTTIGDFSVTDINKIGNDRYYVTFKPEKAIFVTTALQVVVTGTATAAKFSPVFPLMKSYHASNAGTCSLYADFDFYGMGRAKKQYMDFYGTEVEDDFGKSGYINHWNIGIYGSYTEPAAVELIPEEIVSDDAPVYNLQGIQVGMESEIQSLPRGFYFSKNKGKFIH